MKIPTAKSVICSIAISLCWVKDIAPQNDCRLYVSVLSRNENVEMNSVVVSFLKRSCCHAQPEQMSSRFKTPMTRPVTSSLTKITPALSRKVETVLFHEISFYSKSGVVTAPRLERARDSVVWSESVRLQQIKDSPLILISTRQKSNDLKIPNSIFVSETRLVIN